MMLFGTFPGAPKPSPGCAAPGHGARNRRRDGGDLAQLHRRLASESGYIHREEAPPIDVTVDVLMFAVLVGIMDHNHL